MIQLHRTFFSTSTSVPSSHTLSFRHFMVTHSLSLSLSLSLIPLFFFLNLSCYRGNNVIVFRLGVASQLQFRALQPPTYALSPHASSTITGTTFQCRRTCVLFPRSVTAKRSPVRSFAVKSTALFGDYFSFPFAANCTTPFDHGLFSKGFSTSVADNGKQGKRVKAVVVRGKEKDGSVISDGASGKDVAKTAKKKTVKKKPSPKKKVSAASNSAHEECAAEVSGKSTKLKRKKVSKVSN